MWEVRLLDSSVRWKVIYTGYNQSLTVHFLNLTSAAGVPDVPPNTFYVKVAGNLKIYGFKLGSEAYRAVLSEALLCSGSSRTR